MGILWPVCLSGHKARLHVTVSSAYSSNLVQCVIPVSHVFHLCDVRHYHVLAPDKQLIGLSHTVNVISDTCTLGGVTYDGFHRAIGSQSYK